MKKEQRNEMNMLDDSILNGHVLQIGPESYQSRSCRSEFVPRRLYLGLSIHGHRSTLILGEGGERGPKGD